MAIAPLQMWIRTIPAATRPRTVMTHPRTVIIAAPSVSLGTASAVLQTKTYAWNSRDVLFAGLTHFEEFRFFDASLEPEERNPLNGQAFHLQHTEYLEHVDLLWELSRERVAAGSLDQFLKRDRKSIRYRIPVDKKFLDELTEWRQELASSIAVAPASRLADSPRTRWLPKGS